MQTKHPFFDDLSKIASSAAGTLHGLGEEAKTFWQSQLERIVTDMDLVRRDEYEILLDRVASLEAQIAAQAANTPNQVPAKAAPKKKSSKS